MGGFRRRSPDPRAARRLRNEKSSRATRDTPLHRLGTLAEDLRQAMKKETFPQAWRMVFRRVWHKRHLVNKAIHRPGIALDRIAETGPIRVNSETLRPPRARPFRDLPSAPSDVVARAVVPEWANRSAEAAMPIGRRFGRSPSAEKHAIERPVVAHREGQAADRHTHAGWKIRCPSARSIRTCAAVIQRQAEVEALSSQAQFTGLALRRQSFEGHRVSRQSRSEVLRASA